MVNYIPGVPTTFVIEAPNGADLVDVGLGTSATVAPTPLIRCPVVNGYWTAVLTPPQGSFYIWVEGYRVVPPQVNLRVSYDKGRTFGNPYPQSVGATGQYLKAPSWRRLGMGRDVVFQLEWSFAGETALNGAFVDLEELAT